MNNKSSFLAVNIVHWKQTKRFLDFKYNAHNLILLDFWTKFFCLVTIYKYLSVVKIWLLENPNLN